jgi:hypothetical protein
VKDARSQRRTRFISHQQDIVHVFKSMSEQQWMHAYTSSCQSLSVLIEALVGNAFGQKPGLFGFYLVCAGYGVLSIVVL